MLGHIDLNQDDNMVVRKYVLVANISGGPSCLPGCWVRRWSNLHIMPSAFIPVLDTFKCIEVMDFGFVLNTDQDIRLVNISKFGTF